MFRFRPSPFWRLELEWDDLVLYCIIWMVFGV